MNSNPGVAHIHHHIGRLGEIGSYLAKVYAIPATWLSNG